MENKKIINEVEEYYSGKIKEHGISAQGVDWNSEASQRLRFVQLLKLVEGDDTFNLLDYGCGYGALLAELKTKFTNFKYTGLDISEEMLNHAKQLFGEDNTVQWIRELDNEIYDYTMVSGIFNVKFDNSNAGWEKYILDTLEVIHTHSTKGFAFNMLTKYYDKEYKKDNLFYADPAFFLDYCKSHFSKYVAILHDYPLYEFTVIVRKQI